MCIASCDFMVAILVYLKKEMGAILVNQNIPKGIELSLSCWYFLLFCQIPE